MTTLRSIGLVLLLVALSAPASAADSDGAMIERVGNLLEPHGKLDGMTKALGRAPEERRDLGFGNEWTRFELYGDELTIRVDVVTHKSWVAGVRVTSLGGEPAMLRRIQRAWGKRAVIGERGIEVRAEKPSEMRRLLRTAWRGVTGKRRGEPDRLRGSHGATLADPLAELTYGWICYEDGSTPEGRDAANALWRDGSRNVLDAVLAGPNPEGRVYAAEAMLRWDLEGDGIGEERRERIARVLALDVPIRACAGCLVFDEKASALVSAATVRDSALCLVLVEVTLGRQTWVGQRILVYDEGHLMARRLPAPGVLACIPVIAREALPEGVLRALHGAVEEGKGFVARDGIATYEIRESELPDAPRAIRDLLAALPEWFR